MQWMVGVLKSPWHFVPGKTEKSILVSCGARLAPFDIKELREITAYDELELDTLGDKKTALFLIMSDTDATFNLLISMVYTQMFNLLCEKADDASILFGNFLLNIRRNSSIFWSQINAWFGKETALRYAWNGVPFGLVLLILGHLYQLVFSCICFLISHFVNHSENIFFGS